MWQEYVTGAAVIVGAAGAGFLVSFGLIRLLQVVAERIRLDLGQFTKRRVRRPIRLMLPTVGVDVALSFFVAPEATFAGLRQLFSIVYIVCFSWFLIGISGIVEDVLRMNYEVDSQDNLKARKVQTQIRFFRRIAVVLVVLVGTATALMTFETVRQLGTTILASAGIAGVIVGFAAQRSLSTFLAGFQVAMTQPIRLDDVVIVEGEWGRVEEITLTYVVVKIWDLRRLVLPITYFIERPFQNWTRVSADLLGTVFLYVDYTIPVDQVRETLRELLQRSSYWDGKVWNLQVTNATERTVELRALMSATDASVLWNLRCEIREKLLTEIQRRFPDSLPRTRAEVRTDGAPANDDPGAPQDGA
jgi:small-conductance mechanosensitive channel